MNKANQDRLTPAFRSFISMPFHVIVAFIATLIMGPEQNRHWFFLFMIFNSFIGFIVGAIAADYVSDKMGKK